jgi:hypothetical protein
LSARFRQKTCATVTRAKNMKLKATIMNESPLASHLPVTALASAPEPSGVCSPGGPTRRPRITAPAGHPGLDATSLLPSACINLQKRNHTPTVSNRYDTDFKSKTYRFEFRHNQQTMNVMHQKTLSNRYEKKCLFVPIWTDLKSPLTLRNSGAASPFQNQMQGRCVTPNPTPNQETLQAASCFTVAVRDVNGKPLKNRCGQPQVPTSCCH